jgi:DNA topoisomerase-1
MISSGLGRYGPFLLHDGSYANLESIEDVFSIGLNRAVTVLADKAAKGPGRGNRAAPVALKDLGAHPDGGAITVREGRYGPYVNWGAVNATLPKGKDPQSVTVEEAMLLIAERAAKAPAGKAKGRKAPAKAANGDGAAKPAKARTTKAKSTAAKGKAKATKTAASKKAAPSKTTEA